MKYTSEISLFYLSCNLVFEWRVVFALVCVIQVKCFGNELSSFFFSFIFSSPFHFPSSPCHLPPPWCFGGFFFFLFYYFHLLIRSLPPRFLAFRKPSSLPLHYFWFRFLFFFKRESNDIERNCIIFRFSWWQWWCIYFIVTWL